MAVLNVWVDIGHIDGNMPFRFVRGGAHQFF